MNSESKTKLFETLVVLLVLVVTAQSVAMFKLYRKEEASNVQTDAELIAMDLIPKAGVAQSPPAGSPNWSPPLSTRPQSGLGFDPGPWDPFKEFRGMRQQMNQMFNESFGRFRQAPDFQSMWGGTSFSPSVDLEEQDNSYIVRMDIPGAEKSNISVTVDDRELTVSGSLDETVEEQGANYLRKERHSGTFRRTLTLPGPVETDGMNATYEDGVLAVTVPKGTGQGAARSIEIK